MTLILWKRKTLDYSFSNRIIYTSRYNTFQFIKKIYNKHTAVKELWSKMFRHHPGWYKAVFLKKTQTIIVSLYEYTVYIMFWIMMLYDCYYYYCHFLSKYHCFLQCKITLFSKSYKESGIKIITINWNIAISCI